MDYDGKSRLFSKISSKLKNQNGNLVSFDGQSKPYRLAINEVKRWTH